MLRAPYRIISLARRFDPARWTEDRRFTNFLDQVDQLARQDLATIPWLQLVGVPRPALGLIDPITELRISYLPRSGLA